MMKIKTMFIIIGLLGSGLALSIPVLKPMFSAKAPTISREEASSPEVKSSSEFGKPQKPEGIIRVVGIGISPDRSIAQSKAKMDAYYKLAQKFGLNADQEGKTEIILKNTRIVRYKSYKKGKNYVYECYLEKLPDD